MIHLVPYAERLIPNSWNATQYDFVMFEDKNGHICNLTTWDIDDEGNVTPSVHCQIPNCGFHEFIKLENYAERI